MKFYFCQACGVRVTEDDIDDGLARNKKLKGVYCSKCAVGVTTMESLPVTEDEAKKLLDADDKAPRDAATPASVARGVRKTSGVRIPPAQKGAASSSRMTQSAPATEHSSARFLVPAIVTMAIVVVGLVVFSGSGGTPSRKSRDRNANAKREQNPKPSPLTPNAGKTDVAHRKVEVSPLAEEPTAQAPVGPSASHKAESAARPIPPEKGASPESSGVTKTETKEPQAPSKETEKTEPATETKPFDSAQGKPFDSAQGKPAEAEAAKAKLSALLDAFDQALFKGDLVAACKVAERAQSDPALKGAAKEVAALVRVGLVLSETAAARQRALAALMDGKKRTLQIRKGSLTGVVRKVEGETLRVRVEGRINKQVIEYEKRVKLEDLTPACRARLLGEKAPATSDGWLARTAWKCAERDLDLAEKALAEAGAHPLAGHYRQRIDALRLAENEAAAQREWEDRVLPLTKTAKFTKTGARKGQKVLSAFRSAHGKTRFAASVARQTKLLERTFQTALGPPKEVTLELGGGVKMEFVLIPAGTFMMGDPGKQHKVTLTKPFYLGKYEVTQAQYERVMGNNPSRWKSPDLPVEKVGWHECQAFCKKLSALTSMKTRLPTEAEWEYACRAGTTTRFSFGDSGAEMDAYGWSRTNSNGKTHPVGQNKPNGFGLYDMHGNVWEWCQDWYGGYAAEAVTDPKGPATGDIRVLRGGSWDNVPGLCTSAFRLGKPPSNHRLDYGLRISLDF